MPNEQVKIAIALTAGLCIGGGLGYLVAERALRSHTEKEVAGVKALYRRLRDEDAAQAREDWNSAPRDEVAEEDLEDDSEESFSEEEVVLGNGYTRVLGYSSADDLPQARHQDPNYIPPTDQELGSDDVDEDLREEDDYVRKIRVINPHRDVDPDDVTQWDRDPHRPYVITEAEFRIDHPEHEKLSISYYQGDDTMADENDQYIPDPDGTVGLENLQFFGLASGDERLLHIRNERVGADFEVTLNDGSYSREVLGFGIEESMVKESKNNIRKMRHRE